MITPKRQFQHMRTAPMRSKATEKILISERTLTCMAHRHQGYMYTEGVNEGKVQGVESALSH